jgi:hypothetical protein
MNRFPWSPIFGSQLKARNVPFLGPSQIREKIDSLKTASLKMMAKQHPCLPKQLRKAPFRYAARCLQHSEHCH